MSHAYKQADPRRSCQCSGVVSPAMPHYEKHVFICTNRRDEKNPKGSCAQKGSEAIRERFKKEFVERGLKGRMRANAAACLDACEHGCTVLVYPEQVWYGHVTVDDVAEIIEKHLVGGEPVARLRIADHR
jgi:(2Fe-2S) ferredoxin